MKHANQKFWDLQLACFVWSRLKTNGKTANPHTREAETIRLPLRLIFWLENNTSQAVTINDKIGEFVIILLNDQWFISLTLSSEFRQASLLQGSLHLGNQQPHSSSAHHSWSHRISFWREDDCRYSLPLQTCFSGHLPPPKLVHPCFFASYDHCD